VELREYTICNYPEDRMSQRLPVRALNYIKQVISKSVIAEWLNTAR